MVCFFFINFDELEVKFNVVFKSFRRKKVPLKYLRISSHFLCDITINYFVFLLNFSATIFENKSVNLSPFNILLLFSFLCSLALSCCFSSYKNCFIFGFNYYYVPIYLLIFSQGSLLFFLFN